MIKTKIFAKIFEYEEGQLLVVKDSEYDEDSETYKYFIEATTDLDDLRPSLKLWFEEEDVMEKTFIDLSDEAALKLYNTLLETGKFFS